MTGLHTALQTFWSGFTNGDAAIPAYPTDNVPEGAVFPYITYDAVQGAYFGTTILTAFVWVQKTGTWAALRASILDQIAAAIPEGGTVLQFSGGAVILSRNTAEFMGYYGDPADANVTGGRISYEIAYFNA